MRISTNTMYELGSRQISDLQSALVKTQQQVSSGMRILTPADDPVAAAAALGMDQALAINDQFALNRSNAKSSLSEEESILQSVTLLLQSVKDVVVGAGNGALDDQQRQMYATQLRSNFDELMGLANSRDSSGNYIFAGYQTGVQPYNQSATGATYSGDQGQRLLQVGAARQMAVSDAGSTVFESGMNGNGRFVTAAGAANTGTGLISTGAVIDQTQLTGNDYAVTFSIDAAGVTTYLVTETPPPAIPATPQPYVSGQAISFGGMQFDIKGAPANGDTFSVKPSQKQSVFTVITDLLATISTTSVGAQGQTRLANGLAAANNSIANALDNVSAVRTTIGSRLKEIDNLDSAGSDLKVKYTATLKQLQEVDPVEAYSSFTQQQYTLEAARQSFIKISGLSLFNMLN
ncbi:flagellar hook-associated protein FlgL [Herminiimonas fonticola]|uniref:Flagellar hook-associated protein 3 FlgL n=1 Tax=Herminiimonas fonticola TaxID=303380 RepID=A0A4R6GJ46_9BURK|nr:flagellar hook-associated protein FlgL [Herminiimonas fonticola]RBA25789.1 flagellar hook-associated protein 3 [Herminiimonas fonticola]TDN94897.1 flagellar hook-associated protein 3 FlgL [Herminiimonas fonticola]